MCSGLAVKDTSWPQGQHNVVLFVSCLMNYIKCIFDTEASLINAILVYSNNGSTDGIWNILLES